MRYALPLILVLGLVWGLKSQFPYALSHPEDSRQLVYLVMFLVLVAGGAGLWRMRAAQAARDAALWLGLILVLVLGYSTRGQWRYSRFMAALVPSRIHVTEEGAMTVDMAQDGHFHLEAEINGTPVYFLVDTGATDIVLTAADARSIGIDPDTLNYSKRYSTANGQSRGAPVMLPNMVVGPFTLKDVPASVNGSPMDTSLLGMAFLTQFREYSVSGDTLTLTP
jgi:aspartyl protease family protein